MGRLLLGTGLDLKLLPKSMGTRVNDGAGPPRDGLVLGNEKLKVRISL